MTRAVCSSIWRFPLTNFIRPLSPIWTEAKDRTEIAVADEGNFYKHKKSRMSGIFVFVSNREKQFCVVRNRPVCRRRNSLCLVRKGTEGGHIAEYDGAEIIRSFGFRIAMFFGHIG